MGDKICPTTEFNSLFLHSHLGTEEKRVWNLFFTFFIYFKIAHLDEKEGA